MGYDALLNYEMKKFPDSKVHGAKMEPIWVLLAPDGPHVGRMNLAIRVRDYILAPIIKHCFHIICTGKILNFDLWIRYTSLSVLVRYFQWNFKDMIFIQCQNLKMQELIHVLKTFHYGDFIMNMMASQITSLTIVYSTVYSGSDQRKQQSSTSLAFVRGINWWIPQTKGQ